MEGHSLFGEIYQENGMSSVDVVISNTPEVETMLPMMNKQLAAYLQNYLPDLKIDQHCVLLLIKTCVCPNLLH